MKTVLSINLGNFGSTGGIARGINAVASKKGFCAYLAYPWDPNNGPQEKNDIIIGSKFGRRASIALGRFTGFNDCFSVFATLKFLRRIDTIKPDIIHLHNLHNCYINLPILFNYIKKKKIPVIWTLHDCWAFTGKCPYFSLVACDKWKTGCFDCPYPRDQYPQTRIDNAKKMWMLKKKWFTGVKRMTIVTPSIWLADLVKESFLKKNPIKVINNGINLAVFRPIPSSFRKTHGINDDQLMLLGVSFGWSYRKGLDVFIELAKCLPKQYRIVLVGTDSKVDKELPSNVISIHKTNNQKELAEMYTAANVFFNPTREDNYPTVNMESLACGTPVVTFNTGGSPEIVDEKTGIVVSGNSMDENISAIKKACSGVFLKEDCLNRAENFDNNKKFNAYIDLYREVEGF